MENPLPHTEDLSYLDPKLEGSLAHSDLQAAIGLEAILIRLEAIAIRLDAILMRLPPDGHFLYQCELYKLESELPLE